MKSYAGIGSRKAPAEILAKAERLAIYFANRNWVLRSGAAPGMDHYFALGAKSVSGAKLEEYLPKKGFNGSSSELISAPQLAFKIAQKVHPAWGALFEGDKAKMARNVLQILGKDLNDPVKFVVCWTPDGCESFHTRSRETGGTGQAIALASMLGIPVFNLAAQGWRDRLISKLDEIEKTPEPQALTTTVVHVRDPHDVYIGRKLDEFGASVFANPHKIGEGATREMQLSNYVKYMEDNPELKYLAKFLKGKKIACWCRHAGETKPACHGDYLAAIAEDKDLSQVYEKAQKALF